ncbi:MAG: M23 family metallopeptidase [Candidatus Peribacteraceae bacterium]|nr:M23 family metallopeptidase [Candidatus Peribacteraceae bacterium]
MLQYLRQQSSFWIAVITVFAFVAGNMMGEHGWYAFWKAVLGGVDDSEIVYQGAVAPIDKVPDYRKWSTYGGNGEENTFRQVPVDLLVPLPAYSAAALESNDTNDLAYLVYSVGWLGSYETGHEGDGSHPGVDIRVPTGTPVRAIMNGIVQTVKDDPGGYGKYVVIRHPNVPDPQDPKKTTTLYSGYAHLSSQEVDEGQLVRLGEEIGLSGRTGDATGPHLHFQIDTDSAPWHLYWPFSGSEARSAGLSFYEATNAGLGQGNGRLHTLSPMAFVQSHPSSSAIVDRPASSSSSTASSSVRVASAEQLRQDRLQKRLARRQVVDSLIGRPLVSLTVPAPISSSASSSSLASSSTSSASSVTTHASAGGVAVKDIRLEHDGRFTGRQSEQLRIILLGADGQTISGTPDLSSPLHLVTDYGKADFEQNDLTAADFTDGEATVTFLPRGQRTIVIRATAFQTQAKPLSYEP